MIIKKIRQCLALILAAALIVSLIPSGVLADEQHAQMIARGIIFQNKEFSLYGHTHRSMMYYMVNPSDGGLPAFCLQPGKRLPNFTSSTYTLYTVNPDQTVPVIGSFERYLPMTLAYEWMTADCYDYTRYGVVQTYMWGCMAGYELDWDVQGQTMERLERVLQNERVMPLFSEMREYVETGIEEYYDTSNSSLPSWNGKQQQMILTDGHYEVVLDISTCPQLKNTVWLFPDSSWNYQIADNGDSIIFQYNGTEAPRGTVQSGQLSGIDTRFYAYLFQPEEQYQMQMGWMDMTRPEVTVSFTVGGGAVVLNQGELELYRHSEVFESNYNISLEKYCAETGQPLAEAVFQVREDFDTSRVNTEGYREGEPDGSFGEVYLNCMWPEPENNYICDRITTDSSGCASHSDIRNYNYSKTYCMGHPAPEWIECDHEGGEGEGEEAEECSCDEENERLREQWLAEQELCAATCDFHVQNDDEDDHGQNTAAMEAMLQDRDATYENFIELEYSYTLEEIQARTGYTLHGKHNDDEPVETVILSSAQAGGNVRGVSGNGKLFENRPDSLAAEQPVEYRYTVPDVRMENQVQLRYGLPEPEQADLEAQRSIFIVTEEEQNTGKASEGGTAKTPEKGLEENPAKTPEKGPEENPAKTTEKGLEENLAKTAEKGTEENPEDGGSVKEETDGGDSDQAGSGNESEKEAEIEEAEAGSENEAEDGEGSDEAEAGEEDGAQAGEAENEAGAGEEGSDGSDEEENLSASIRKRGAGQLLTSAGTEAAAQTATSSTATASTASVYSELSSDESTEIFEYTRIPVLPEWNFSLFSAVLFSDEEEEDDDATITVSLPDFMDDDLDSMDTSEYGDSGQVLYVFKVWDHRTEGKIFINKRDRDLYLQEEQDSYGRTQGDATLEGAVYGLFAAQDIVHPDGISGVIYRQNELVAAAATDKNGDASFTACTEKPGTILNEDGTIRTPEGMTGPENLYSGASVSSSEEGFGTITYPDYREINGSQWIGRPLLMGSYYIQELSRSEGYELSVEGMASSETNREKEKAAVVYAAGQVRVLHGLSDNYDMQADGSWNDFSVERYRTEQGYDITVSGYPQGTRFYRTETREKTETVRVIAGSSLEQKKDIFGNPVYQKAQGGEYRTGADGNPLLKADPLPEELIPASETLPYRFRTAPYPQGTASPEDMSAWDEEINGAYLKQQVNAMLKQMGYRTARTAEGAPWEELALGNVKNSQAAAAVLDWFTEHSFFDCGQVDAVYERDGSWYARLFYDCTDREEQRPAVYDAASGVLYVCREAAVSGGPSEKVHCWLAYEKGSFRLGSRTVYVKERKEAEGEIPFGENIEACFRTVYQPVYETYGPGELLLDADGAFIPVMERVPVYEQREITGQELVMEPVDAVYDRQSGIYRIHMDNDRGWADETGPVCDTFRAVTVEKSISCDGGDMMYNRYLVQVEGAAVSVSAPLPETDHGSYIKYRILSYPGQNTPIQDGGTEAEPVQVLQRVIRQPVRVTKDISQDSYDGANTYGSVHNDPLTSFLGLFRAGRPAQGAKTAKGFRFKIYLKSSLEKLWADPEGIRPLLEKKEDGSPDYKKFFDAMYCADRNRKQKEEGSFGGAAPAVRQFALDYYDIAGYKKEILMAEPGIASDRAYDRALERAEREAEAYLSSFEGLDEQLAVAWDREEGGGGDGDPFTLECNRKDGQDDYYNISVPLPYGAYVIAEQLPDEDPSGLISRHYKRDEPREIVLPFVPDIPESENEGISDQERADYSMGSTYFRYSSSDTPEDLIRKYKIRFNEETHVIRAHGHDGDFLIFKYGLSPALKESYRECKSESEQAGTRDQVVFESGETESGQLEIRDNVPTMTGVQTAVEGKYAPMLVPWTVRAPETDRINPDTGDVETLFPSGSGESFNYAAFAQTDFENTYFRSRLRIEKLDSETGDNIIHDGALFKIYAAKRDVKKDEKGQIAGSGRVLFGEAVDVNGDPVKDAEGKMILYPRVGKDNGSSDDLPIHLDENGIPQYDESQLIRQKDEEGTERGIFKAYSTVKEIERDGRIRKEITGYIETIEPLGAGVYILVEIRAPEGYAKSRPVAFELYADETAYYEEMREGDGTTGGWRREPAMIYQYAVPVSEGRDKYGEEASGQVKVKNYPSRMEIHKVEDGDSLVGNENLLKKTDAQGREEESGGFEDELTVNDKGDLLIYRVCGRKEKLEARGDVRDIAWDEDAGEWYGYVTKAFDQYSEHVIEGTETELKAMTHVKPLYRMDGSFTGKGIRFDISVSGAGLALYRGIRLEKTGEHTYKGVEAVMQGGKVTAVRNTNTGTGKELLPDGFDEGPAHLELWDSVEIENEPVNLFFYELTGENAPALEKAADTGELLVLDERGNHICYADPVTGMAYVYDDYGQVIAYVADEKGEKMPVRSVRVREDEAGKTIYWDKQTADDENGLPLYYESGRIETKEERWITDESSGPDGKPEQSGGIHSIARLPFGAYILEEEETPLEQGYIRSEYKGLILEDTEEVQKYFLQNDFTKAAFAKIDIMTQKEIQGAEMTLYRALTDEEGQPLKDASGRYEKGEKYTSWISGYVCDDDGVPKMDEEGRMIPDPGPHWIDHLPPGAYVLEETVCPYDQGYVLSESVNVDVLETGDVQSFEMEDDFTALEIYKYDTKKQEVLYGESEAYLTLYETCRTDENYEKADALFTFRAATWKDREEVASTGRLTPDASGGRPIMKYDYEFLPIPGTRQGRYYYTEKGTVRLEYLPTGHYILEETANPEGYGTAEPILIEVADIGHMKEIPRVDMGDEPLRIEISKVNITGGKEVSGAKLTVYPADEQGNAQESPLIIRKPAENGRYEDITVSWISGLDGRYTKEDAEAGLLPEGFEIGDRKPHLIEYIPEGKYILREETTPYGFLQSADVPFEIRDTALVQKAEMTDEIPDGVLRIRKSDADDPQQRLAGAEFELINKTLEKSCQQVITDEQGRAEFDRQPIGYMDREGNFCPYTYECREIRAAEGHMLTLPPAEFQFSYEDPRTAVIFLEYDPVNDSNRVKAEKVLGDTEELLEGAVLKLEIREERGNETRENTEESWIAVDQWISGKQAHYVKGLKAGFYRLTEIQAPAGFPAAAEPICFEIRDGMTEIPSFIMRNYSMILNVEKTDRSTGKLLAGARLQLLEKDSGRLIREWISEEDRAQTFYGLEPGTYVIRELEAPSGYKKAPDLEIQADGDAGHVRTVNFANTKISASGGGGGGNTPSVEYISFKKVNTSGNPVVGAEFTFYDQAGEIIGTSVSDLSGRFRICRPQNGTYTFRETKAPDGYGLNRDIYSFTVSGDQVIRGIYEVKDRELKVDIRKKDGLTEEALAGAELRIEKLAQDRWEKVFEGITDEAGMLLFEAQEPGQYRICEAKAPEGYVRTDTVCEFAVDEEGNVSGTTVVYNFRKPVVIGKITAQYKVNPRFENGSFRAGHPGTGGRNIRTGDAMPLYETIAVLILCMAGALAGGFREKKRRDSRLIKLPLLIVGITAAGVCMSLEVRAESRSPRYVSDEIFYSTVEDAEEIPQTAWITVKDEDTGREREVLLPILKSTFMNDRWLSDFKTEIAVQGYGAEYLILGNGLVKSAEPEALLDYGEELLTLAGLNPENYSIDSIRWLEDDGSVRKLEASGRRRVRDCIAVYGGYEGRQTETGPEEKTVTGIWQDVRRIALPVLVGSLLAAAGIYLWMKFPKAFFILFLAGGILCIVRLAAFAGAYRKAAHFYTNVREIAGAGQKENAEETDGENVSRGQKMPEKQALSENGIREEELRQMNQEYRFWLQIPGTGIDYPVVQHEDDIYYLTHAFDHSEQAAGCIFLDSSCVPLQSANTVIYGHNMKDGSMFGDLKQYREERFFREHPVLRLYYKDKWMECPIFSCQLREEKDSEALLQGLFGKEWEVFLEKMEEDSLYSTGISPAPEDRVITLCSCFGKDKRMIVQALLEPESAL
ncbi:MAG: SpaA isopeptide-forming pilin-related protein [Enterocloster sp.]